jgi:hypothetical protein
MLDIIPLEIANILMLISMLKKELLSKNEGFATQNPG